VVNKQIVLILDDSEELVDLFKLLIESQCGCMTVTAKSLTEVMNQREKVKNCSLAILDINLGPDEPSGIEAYRWLKANDFDGKIVFLTGHAVSHPLVASAQSLGDAQVFNKPLSADSIIQMVRGKYAG